MQSITLSVRPRPRPAHFFVCLLLFFWYFFGGLVIVKRPVKQVFSHEATASWVFTSTLESFKCLSQGHFMAVVGFEPWTSRSEIRRCTTESPHPLHFSCTLVYDNSSSSVDSRRVYVSGINFTNLVPRLIVH